MSEDTPDIKKYHVLSPKGKKIVLLVSVFFILIVVPLLGYLYYNVAVNRPSQTGKETTLEIERGDSISEIASELYRNDVINSEFLFKLYVTINKMQNNIQAGVYTIPAGISLTELSNMLQYGTNDQTITFLEGWRAEEFARQASSSLEHIDYADFLKIAKPYEGYLYPDTYRFNVDANEEDVLKALRSTFQDRTEEVLTAGELTRIGLTAEEVVIIASIVEREVNTPEDRPLVAGILIRRLRDGELLGADATTQYAIAALRYGCDPESAQVCPDIEEVPDINWWPDDLTIAELDNESPFNTRKVTGLPPSPIANPGLDAIKSVINFQESEYYYYLTDNSGITHYAKTLEEHNQNIGQYL